MNLNEQTVNRWCNRLAKDAMRLAQLPAGPLYFQASIRTMADRIIALRTNEAREQAQSAGGAL